MTQYKQMAAAIAIATLATSPTWAAVSADEAAQLRATLTPLGAEKAGNKDGTIPAWSGAYSAALPGAGNGKYPDPFASEKPVLQITAQNMGQHAGKLTEGTMALLKKYPTFRVDVYPTHRTAGAPQWVYDNTLKAATTAKLTDNGMSFEGAWGGIPFPIPKSGNEVMMNHLVHPTPPAFDSVSRNFVGTSDGQHSMASKTQLSNLASYWQKDGSADKYNKVYRYVRFETVAPTFKAGEAVVVHDSLDVAQDPPAWQYLVGQRRVRRAPTIGYDTPDFIASGANYFDEVYGFMGRLDRYNWKLVGKQEIYVPYNNNRFFAAGEEKALVPFHTNPDAVRWELHRVWVVEATLAQGKRHAVPKRRLYIDEDSWSVLTMDGYDAEGKLWRVSHVMNQVVPEAGGALDSSCAVVYNLQANSMSVIQYVDSLKLVKPRPVSYFTGDALSNAGAR
ncbi:DUF1329 domain-containing protein [Ralstonia flatus]|uniref:DUF1329 domain-containing protein n=1 Tax=Ralstonia flatus TaxID=3058601 RepID=A0ABM9L0W7_9RALS|nr:DUF1329 domain-containing protein [Ralstonia sp. LMG 32965]CAJ0896172.1 hypothetical protein R77564_03964 [Ralstonia sp. LMG 32965]